MIRIQNKELCCGCSACGQICPRNCITMEEDAEGFSYPVADEDRCVWCGLCERVCPVLNAEPRDDSIIRACACSSADQESRARSSSGGMFYLIARRVLECGGVVYGAEFDGEYNVRHAQVTDVAGLNRLFGSKYVQSDLGNCFSEIRDLLDEGKTVLFSGTACQGSGLKSFLKKPYDNLIIVDVLCHGVPSPRVWRSYLNEKQAACQSEPVSVSFRAKTQGWKLFSLRIEFANGRVYEKNLLEDDYLKLFLRDICLRPSCHSCRFKMLDRDSDISLGDCWGIEKLHADMDDDKGTSIVIIHSPKGSEIFDAISGETRYLEDEVDRLLPETMHSRCAVKPHPKREEFFSRLENGERVSRLVKLTEPSFVDKVKRRLKRIISG